MEREPGKQEDKSNLDIINQKLDELSLSMEKLGIAEYVEMLRNPRRLFFINFWAGLSRGFGMAIGFTVLAAVVIYILQRLIVLNVPLIGDFIADLVNIVQIQLRIR
ncbi:MAG: DUF5665 domain-containing protein [Syntrophomonadaceae bacterium]|nr:DUF5665 domain-containing protein [Syntrophomonadaceae bacterium]MDD3024510.1 DUF5665 domain-containing protein [Syntrophomonadaceae bacterium]